MQFINYRPNVVLIDNDGKTHIIRKKESLATFKKVEFDPKRG
jgi:diaminopimelate decarboxylase